MIESLRKSESRFLALFAACTFGLGFVVAIMVRVFHARTPAATGDAALHAWARLEMGAAATSLHVAVVSLFLEVISFMVLSLAYMKESEGNDDGVVRVMARTLYVASFIAMIAAISTAMAFMMVHT
jgi:hypothetical protein